MATLKTRWLLSILLVNLPNHITPTVSPGPPVLPSPPQCYSPCDEKACLVDIHCTWDPSQEPQIPTNYSLHWKSEESEDEHVISLTSFSGYIHREHFIHDKLHVWVQAKNLHGSAKSPEAVFYAEDITKSPPPKVTSHEPFEISWVFSCDHLDLSLGYCDVRHRTEADQDWFEDEGFHASYTVDTPQPCTVYEFQVRCSCGTGLMSDWSTIHKMPGTESTPVGKLDLWQDCGISPTLDCVLTWKRLPTSQACDLILGYEVRLSYKNGAAVLLNVSTAEPKDQLVCDEMQCQINSSLKDASSVSVLAYNAHGATMPSYLAMPVQGTEKNKQTFDPKMNEESLTVSWDLPSQLSDNLKEYVVQYKQAGCPLGQGFDWVKVTKNQTTAVFKGQFKKYTPYQVSLFTVSNSNEAHHITSVIRYSLQGRPSAVQSFEVLSIADNHVTLLWEPLPLSKQNGVILYYQLGVDGQNVSLRVYNVSASPQHENKTFQLSDLSPGQDYEVWIRAVTAAGPGEKVTMRFKTKDHEYFAYTLLGIMCVVVVGILVFVSSCRGGNKACPLVSPCYCDKVPDPRNSRIFKEMKHQINDPMAWIRRPIYEPHPKISLLEVVEIQPWVTNSALEETSADDGLTRPVVCEGSSQTDCQDDQRVDNVTEECPRTDHKYGREPYSKMVDSDEERDKEEEEEWKDCCSSSEEEPGTSGYEKHFMPSAFEILGVL